MTHKILLAILLAIVPCASFGRADDAPVPAPAVDPKLKEALDNAAAVFDEMAAKGKEDAEASKKFMRLLQGVGEKFQPVPIGQTAGKADWKTVTLNTAGSGLDCIRLHTPKGDACDMAWGFHCKQSRFVAWYIFPVSGDPNGFKNFFNIDPTRLHGLKVPADDFMVLQYLTAAALKPDTDYLIYFKFTDKQPIALELAIDFLKKESVENDSSKLADALGLKIVAPGL